MLGNRNLTSLTFSTLGAGLTLTLIDPFHNLNLQQWGSALANVGVVTAGSAVTYAGLKLGSTHAVRLWRQYQAALPPPGTKNIKPERMKAFFDRHASDKPEQAGLLMGFTSTASAETLEETARRVASEKEDLTQAL